jgi:hypothetical protein
MTRVRDLILVLCALICAGTAVYIVYNIEVFKHRVTMSKSSGSPTNNNNSPAAAQTRPSQRVYL